MSDTDTILLPKPHGKIRAALDNDVTELLRKYGVVLILAWQFIGPGIKDAMREVVRSEMAPLQAQILKLETRLAALEKDLQ